MSVFQGKLVGRITLFLCAALAVTSVDAASYEKIDGTIVDPILDIHGNVLSYSGNNLRPWANLEPLANLSYANLSYANLHYAILNYVNLRGANLTNADLAHAYLLESFLGWADLDSANLTGANLTGAELYEATLTNADLNNAYLDSADFTNANLTGANFTGATDAPSTSSQLALTPLEETIIVGAQLHEANVSGADLSGVIFDHENDALDAVGWETAIWMGANFHYLNPTLFPTGMIHTDHGIVVRTPEPAAILLALFGLALLPRRRRR